MTTTDVSGDAADVQAVAEHYQQAAQALLLAYQRNKEATRHHSDGAFRAALHHARQSCEHVSAAHAHLDQALMLSRKISARSPGVAPISSGPGLRQDH